MSDLSIRQNYCEEVSIALMLIATLVCALSQDIAHLVGIRVAERRSIHVGEAISIQAPIYDAS